MRVRESTTIELIALALGATVAIALATQGAGYWALAASSLVTHSMRLVLALALTGYRPKWPRRDPATMAMVTFGGYLVLSNVVTYMSRNTDSILVGRVWGAEALGYYSRAYFLMTVPTMLFTSALGRVMVPALSALAYDRERMGAAYQQAIRSLAFAAFPIAIGIAVTAPEVVRLIYGPRWEDVIPMLALLSVAMVTEVISGTIYWLYTAVGRARLQFGVGLIVASVVVLSNLIGVQYGPIGVATGYAIASAVIALPGLAVAHRVANLPLSPTLAVLRPILLVVLIMGFCSYATGLIVERAWDSWPLTLITKIGVGGLVYGLLAFRWLKPWPLPILERLRWRIDQHFFPGPGK